MVSSAHHYLILPEESVLLYDACITVMGAEALTQQTASFSETPLLHPFFHTVP